MKIAICDDSREDRDALREACGHGIQEENGLNRLQD